MNYSLAYAPIFADFDDNKESAIYSQVADHKLLNPMTGALYNEYMNESQTCR